jgi:hypothetical protein
MRLSKLATLVVALFLSISSFGQVDLGAKVGKGIQFKTENDDFYLKFRTRVQTRWDFQDYLTDNVNLNQTFENRAYVKRARLKFDGYFLNKNLRYKIEYDVVAGYVRDAAIKYKMGNFDLWFGQAKLPGNRERVVSSANMQLVDRSIYNSYLNIDRDIGFQLHHSFKIGNVIVRDIYAISAGNGIVNNKASDGLNFTGKLEVLPFGAFKNKGDYVSADVYREETPKLALAVWGDYNMGSNKDRGQIGSVINNTTEFADLLTLGFDMIFKYNGFSFMAEAGSRGVATKDFLIYDPAGQIIDAYYQGYGLNLQSGYIFKNNYEISGRYSFSNPDDQISQNLNKKGFEDITDYTLGISKYIVGHSFKIQADFTYRETELTSNMFIARLQLEFQI